MATPPPLDDEEIQVEEPVQLVGVDLTSSEPAAAPTEDGDAAAADEEDVPIHEPEIALNEEPPVITLEQSAPPAAAAAPASLHVDLTESTTTDEPVASVAPGAGAASDVSDGAEHAGAEHQPPAVSTHEEPTAVAAAAVVSEDKEHAHEATTATPIEDTKEHSAADAADANAVPTTTPAVAIPAAHNAESDDTHKQPAAVSEPIADTHAAAAHAQVSEVAATESVPLEMASIESEAKHVVDLEEKHEKHPEEKKEESSIPVVALAASTPVAPTATTTAVSASTSTTSTATDTSSSSPPTATAGVPATGVSEAGRSAPRPIVAPIRTDSVPEPSPFMLSPPHPIHAPAATTAGAPSGLSSVQTTSTAASPAITPTPLAASTPAPAPAPSRAATSSTTTNTTSTAPAPTAVPAPSLAAAAVSSSTPRPAAAAASWASPAVASTESSVPNTGLSVTVSDPERIGDGFSSYMAYTVRTKTQLPQFANGNVSVKHRYNDFYTLFKYLEGQYPGLIVPTPPPKDALSTGLTKFKSGSENSAFIERRTHALSRFMARIAAHPQLFSDDVLRTFLSSGEKIDSKVSVTPKKDFGDGEPGPEELKSKEWFDTKIKSLESLDHQLKKLHVLLDGVVDRRKELASCLNAFVESISAAANTEEVTTLAKALHTLADVESRVAKLHSQEAMTEFFDLSEIVDDYLGLLTAIRTALGQRQQAQKDVQSAEATLAKKREAEAKAKPEKKEQATRDVGEAERLLRRARLAYHQITLRVTNELLVFDQTKVLDFKAMVLKYVESLIGTEEQILRAWEQFLPDARAITV